ncbi:MAG: nucleoside triphosphate pyrophosphohydrolase family protein [Thermoplasmatota archaeon]
MARILVAGTTESLGGRGLAERVVARVRADGHDAALLGATPLPEVREADAVVALLDGPVPPPAAVGAAATAHALGKPALALHTHPLGDAIATLFTQTHAVHGEEEFAPALAAFYAQVRPFAGRLVRDQVPRLVREAGHAVSFREAVGEERARFLKRKVAEEAAELLAAGPGEEREEVADLLEALEALLVERGVARDDLKLVKEAKRRRRGAFERCFVVESVAGGTPVEAAPTHASPGPVMAADDEDSDAETETAIPAWPGERSAPLFPSTRASAAASAPPQEADTGAGRRTELWNLGSGGRREAIRPKVEDPDRIEPALRDL